MNVKIIASLVAATAVFSSFAVNLNNGNISVEVNGDGRIGALQYFGSNHINECSIRLRHSSDMFTTEKINATEKSYPNFQMMTGYGRQPNSNMYVVTTSRIYGTNTSVDQTIVVLTRKEAQLGITYFLNADVQQTKDKDLGTFNGANNTIVQNEGPRYIGLMATRNSQVPNSHVIDDLPNVVTELPQSALSGSVVTNSPPDMAAAVAWDNVAVNSKSATVKTKVMTGKSDFEIQNLTNADDPPVHVLTDIDIFLRKTSFNQKFSKFGKDKIQVKGEIDMTDFPGVFDNLASMDVSFFIGDYLAFLPGDGSETKVKKGTRIHKLDDPIGKRKLSLKSKKGIIKFTMTASKANIKPATLLTENAPVGLKQKMHLPWTMVFTGTNPNDIIKGGRVWIIGMSSLLEVDKKNEKKAKGKLLK